MFLEKADDETEQEDEEECEMEEEPDDGIPNMHLEVGSIVYLRRVIKTNVALRNPAKPGQHDLK